MISINVLDNPDKLGKAAAKKIALFINEALKERGKARIILSTGASQFGTLDALVREDVDWTAVEMFHLDEYVGLPVTHAASFRKYLQERFVSKLPLKAAHFVNGEGDVERNIRALTDKLLEDQIDVGVIGIGENGHIAFNDPPADFDTETAYKVVTLDRRCREQQVREGWFSCVEDVPSEAITMCPKRIMASRHIVSAVPHAVKAEAVLNTVTKPVDPMIPATLLKTHPDWNLFLDASSASLLLALPEY